jgi:hypothetical protein
MAGNLKVERESKEKFCCGVVGAIRKPQVGIKGDSHRLEAYATNFASNTLSGTRGTWVR